MASGCRSRLFCVRNVQACAAASDVMAAAIIIAQVSHGPSDRKSRPKPMGSRRQTHSFTLAAAETRIGRGAAATTRPWRVLPIRASAATRAWRIVIAVEAAPKTLRMPVKTRRPRISIVCVWAGAAIAPIRTGARATNRARWIPMVPRRAWAANWARRVAPIGSRAARRPRRVPAPCVRLVSRHHRR